MDIERKRGKSMTEYAPWILRYIHWRYGYDMHNRAF